MRNWYPFSDYDFYGYLTSGFVLLFALDYAFTGGTIMLRANWTFVQIVLVVGLAYFVGHLTASPSSLLIEHLFARTLLHPPIKVMLMRNEPGLLTRAVGRGLIGRYYERLPAPQREIIIRRAAADNGTTQEVVEADTELVFGPAFQAARKDADTRQRVDDFRNQYGLTRNMAFTALLAAGLFGWRAWCRGDPEARIWAVLALVLFVGMLLRFLKFYAAFQGELLRAYSYGDIQNQSGKE